MYAHCPLHLPKKVTKKPSVNHKASSMSHQQSVSYEKPYSMQFSVSACESCTLCCVLLDCNGTKYTGNGLSIPAVACSQQLLRRNKLPTGCYFFACLVFSPHDMNVFVTDLTANNVVTHMQGFTSGILMILFEKLCEM